MEWSSSLTIFKFGKMYTLRRGRTSAVVEGADWLKDGRLLAIGTRKRTVRVFPYNPYGGKTSLYLTISCSFSTTIHTQF